MYGKIVVTWYNPCTLIGYGPYKLFSLLILLKIKDMIKVKSLKKSKSRYAQLKTKLRVFGQKIFSNRRFIGANGIFLANV